MLILIRFSGEVSTKAPRARARLAQCMASNIREALDAARIEHRIHREWSRFFVETESSRAPDVLQRIFGIQSFSIVEKVPVKRLEEVVAHGKSLYCHEVEGKRFAVRARIARGGQFMPFRSVDIERELGAALAPFAAKVDLTDPEVTVQVELRQYHAYFFTRRFSGPGGLPIGQEGRIALLSSGGFDSAVASWMLMKRGVAVDYIFCNLGGKAHKKEVLRVLKVLADQWSYGSRPTLHVVDFESVVREIQSKARSRYWQVLLKRMMYRVAGSISREIGCQGIATGEALSQVSSQTLTNLETISQAVALPIFRPVIGLNKEEIIKTAREIGTYEFSASVKEHCAIVPQYPATRARLEQINPEEAGLDWEVLDQAVQSREIFQLRDYAVESLGAAADVELDYIPENAIVLDLRSRSAYDLWHYPGARHLDFLQALDEYGKLEKGAPYLLYCEVGIKSAQVAERMREAGFEAYNFRGGMKNLIPYAQEKEALAPELLQPANIFG